MITGRCKNCNFIARYNSRYFSVSELKRHTISFPAEQDECNHSMIYLEDEKN